MNNLGECAFNKIGFLGLGLIGGSIAHAIHEKHPDAELIAYDPDSVSLQEALDDNVISKAVQQIDQSFSDCDLIYLCAPVQYNDDNLARIKPYLKADTLLTDIGSVKTDIHRHVRNAGLEEQFIGGHPMAGSERIGYRNSSSGLLENAYYILTPEPAADKTILSRFRDFVSSLGALPLVLEDPSEHDRIVAGISHVPHVISALLVNLVRDSDNSQEVMKTVAAGGFKDITRISSSSPVMWQQICLTNRDNILPFLREYVDDLEEITALIENEDQDGIFDFFSSARAYRESFSESSAGPIKKQYIMHVDIADRPGVLAEVVTLLALQNINIKNIGITHNREYQQGALRVELESEEGLSGAVRILKSHNYTIH